VRLDSAVVQDVPDREAPLYKRAAHQQAAMTVQRLALGAHQADALPCRDIHQFAKAGLEFRLRGHRLVIGNSIAVEVRLTRPAAERGAERQVAHTILTEPGLQPLGGEPGKMPRDRRRAHVGDGIDARRA
jgi:hypothetical protein